MQKVYFKKLVEEAKIPEYKTENAVGADIYSVEDVIIKAGERAIISTGLASEFAGNLEVQIRGRSGLAFNNNVVAFNGTIDGDFSGEWKVLLWNFGKEDFKVSKGDRIAQMIVNEIPLIDFKIVTELKETDRGTGGFGSTGK